MMFPTDQESQQCKHTNIHTSPTTAVPSGITLICPGEAPGSVTAQTPIHIL